MIYNITIFWNRSHFQTQLEKRCKMMYNFTIFYNKDWTGLEWTGVEWIGVGWGGVRLDWTDLSSLGWTELDWTGLDWSGVDSTQMYALGSILGRVHMESTGVHWSPVESIWTLGGTEKYCEFLVFFKVGLNCQAMTEQKLRDAKPHHTVVTL
jgi:hypothetical protein